MGGNETDDRGRADDEPDLMLVLPGCSGPYSQFLEPRSKSSPDATGL